VKLTIPKGTNSGKSFRLNGLGMPKIKNPSQRGDLYATVEAQIPQNLSKEEEELLEKWRELRAG
jgi:curved DNA-binding protein